jgi:D-amino-acid oxidase
MNGRVIVVGAGVIGLTCAVRLAEAGLDVDVLARDLPAETTSAVAGGLWLPYLAEPMAEVARWSRASLAVFTALAAGDGSTGPGATGVRIVPGTLLHHGPTAPPAWADAVSDLVQLTPVGDPAPGYSFGHRLAVPLIDMPRYLEYLARRLRAANGTLTRLPLSALPSRSIVINCTGVAARALAGDPSVRAVRGQTVLLSDPGLTEWFCDEYGDQLTYVLPRGRDVVVGGTLQDGDWGTIPDDAIARSIVERATALVPALRTAQILGHRVGLRPSRPAVRVETQVLPNDGDPGHAVVHCYGHGGSGVTMSWGCADDVVDAVSELVAEPVKKG